MKNTIVAFLFSFAFIAGSYAPGGIRSIDFKNFTYEPLCAGEDAEKVTVKNGEFSSEKKVDDYIDRFYFSVFNIEFGDLDGDKQDEAIILSVCNTGGTGNFTEGFVYKMVGGKPVRAARLMGGDRAYGGLKSAKVKDGFVIVERYDPGENGASCCPEFILTEKYKLEKDKLVEIGRGVQSEIYPKERIVFDKGTTGKTVIVTISAGERKRYVVAAKAGQRLSVSAGVTEAQLRLLEEARVTEGVNNFLAVLPKNGDYTIEVSHSSDKELKVTVNIKIQ